jgi:hypothetical protein
MEYLTRTVGHFIGQVAEWCYQKGVPPLNSLAVNAVTQEPGDGYDGAAGCNLNNWWDQVRACIACKKYPQPI